MKTLFNKSALLNKTSTAGIFIALVLLMPAIPAAAQSATYRPGIFYAISGHGLKDTSYIFGTYHLIKNSYLDGMPHVQKALHDAKGVVVEVVIDSTKMTEMQSMGLMKDKTLTSLLDKPFADSLDHELKATIGAGLAQLNQMKPAMVSLTLSLVITMKNNADKINQYTGSPLDVYFVNYGTRQAKTITPLETVQQQMDLLFNKTSEAEQLKGLKLFVRNKAEITKLSDELLSAWLANDMDGMNAIYQKYVNASGDADYLLKDRNMAWVKVLPGLMQSKKQFIGVGALHLAGPTGVVEQLRKQGYTVTPQSL